MKTYVTLQEFAGDVVMPIPDELLEQLSLKIDADVDVRAEKGRLVIQPLANPPASKEQSDTRS
ncbi:hypothetical protein PMI07_004952 [Rhizobium sp. CF080]|uniref:AbrB/MazE/SpoVT family DNA-binding domain-containing protein n=1 Tax=Rhizobium sp. (strain CF080) TaxID=1144310 RepID=UPI0002715FD0|nr:hypothetical protein [Rhizobium sp. CF080]EUB98671.1 hypothetical protein PMI07_004952 [Rhizobium sp. CF080]